LAVGVHAKCGFLLEFEQIGDLGEDAGDLEIGGTHLERHTAGTDARDSNGHPGGDRGHHRGVPAHQDRPHQRMLGVRRHALAECRPGTTPAYRAEAARNAPTMAARSITPATTPYRVPRSIETSTIARVVQSIQFTVMVAPSLPSAPREYHSRSRTPARSWRAI